ncbi:carboxypeptidase-like regulatory domain-containing protein, partial [Arthrospira platensis SPKY2]
MSATIVDDQFEKPLVNVHILNMNSVKGSITNEKGIFSIEAKVNDTLFISMVGFQSLRVRVTNDWIKSKETKLKLTE